jgi:hypothetical protein
MTTWGQFLADYQGVQYTPSLTGILPIVLLTWQGTGTDMWDTTPPQPAAVASAAAAAFPNVFY